MTLLELPRLRRKGIAIAGSGRVGQALGRLLYEAGRPVVAIASRDPANRDKAAAFVGAGVRALRYEDLPLRCDRILIAVPDDAIRAVASRLADAGFRDGLVLHTSGYHGTEVLSCLEVGGSSCAALHPLQTIPSPEKGLEALRDCLFVVTGRGEAVEWAREIVLCLGSREVEISEQAKPLYHAAAVMGCNYLVVLLDAALKVLGSAGMDRPEVRVEFFRLIEQTLMNVRHAPAARVLTGPLVRGDVETVSGHLKALREAGLLEVEALYRILGLAGLGLARTQGLQPAVAETLEGIFRKTVWRGEELTQEPEDDEGQNHRS
jgi:predicted short-subunit dehydrogenase-like oxidoreductase (DUF2520 family)